MSVKELYVAIEIVHNDIMTLKILDEDLMMGAIKPSSEKANFENRHSEIDCFLLQCSHFASFEASIRFLWQLGRADWPQFVFGRNPVRGPRFCSGHRSSGCRFGHCRFARSSPKPVCLVLSSRARCPSGRSSPVAPRREVASNLG